MKRVMMAVLLILSSAATYAACTPSSDPAKPVVCIDRATGAATPNPVHVQGARKVKFKWVNGGGIKVTFNDPSLFNNQTSGSEATAVANSYSVQMQTDYTAADETTGKGTDPTIIIDPSAKGKKGHRGKKKD